MSEHAKGANFRTVARREAKAASAAEIHCQFETSAARYADCPAPAGPEVAFVGRSNAGKSSTLNRIARARVARVSKTPGRTQLINFFAVPGGGRLVDLPGYGYAKAAKSKRASWGAAIDAYLNERDVLALIVIVMDMRHPLMPHDEAMLDWCTAGGTDALVVLNKADKLKQGERAKTQKAVTTGLDGRATVLPFSAQTGAGANRVVEVIRGALERK